MLSMVVVVDIILSFMRWAGSPTIVGLGESTTIELGEPYLLYAARHDAMMCGIFGRTHSAGS